MEMPAATQRAKLIFPGFSYSLKRSGIIIYPSWYFDEGPGADIILKIFCIIKKKRQVLQPQRSHVRFCRVVK